MIAAHTNAFKINEDVVIPLERLGEYNDGLERIIIEQSIHNKLRIIDAVLEYLDGDLPELRDSLDYEESSDPDLIEGKKGAAREQLHRVRDDWRLWLDNLDAPAVGFLESLPEKVGAKARDNDTLLDLLQRRDLRISYRRRVEHPLKEIFFGRGLEGMCRRFDAIHAGLRASRLFIATHMHAGDGNVHTNIPVFSNDYAMLQEAERIVHRIMHLVRELGRVISGEHGIGITKM